MNIAADGFVAIQTEIFPREGAASGTFDIVLDLGD